MLERASGTVERILGRHDDTVVTVSRNDGSTGSHGSSSSSTFVNTERFYSTAFELGDQTYKYTDTDHIILEAGDSVRLVWHRRPDGVRVVDAMINDSRGITRLHDYDPHPPLVLASLLIIFVVSVAFLVQPSFPEDQGVFTARLWIPGLLVLIIAAVALRKVFADRDYVRRVNKILLEGVKP